MNRNDIVKGRSTSHKTTLLRANKFMHNTVKPISENFRDNLVRNNIKRYRSKILHVIGAINFRDQNNISFALRIGGKIEK